MKKIPIGVSSCLVGNNVRYNGGNCHKAYITGGYANYFDYKVVCPEVAAGLGVPRPTLFLVEDTSKNLLAIKTSKIHDDITDEINSGIEKIISKLGMVYGFILRAKSPSCGVQTARVFDEQHNYTGAKVDGVFVRALRKYDPLLPLEDDGRLTDKTLRDHFLRKVFCYYDLKTTLMDCKNISQIMEYHSKHKVLLRLYNNKLKKELGNMVADNSKNSDLQTLKAKYIELFMQAIDKPVGRGAHHMALQNVLREINKRVSKSQRQYLQEILNKYKDSKVSWDVPVGIIKMYLLEAELPYLNKQSYLNPYPDDLMTI
ncbi:DUF1722 domain-containing protein [Allofrancisella guangzhouensis]|uniref:DUF1722 domain-containing protein n=1 Tax=Allofrancisella guangzhouensis TaxID=594679 RepID=A0A0A8E3P5_9GAMM|nr:DUF523 and DUF1722 domain-containing protein [Allofrancisella guangzhouensis]AJC48242.1 hypothetical protein SD28_00465 [Allofrancisella guangzhouensis]MBK2027531.1 DUF1722 domain-containing protein [Allofrancisella guangzhouensis]MBK2043766.1 DUF1722 domain-containing protein [Allofrancisella guangzhouensis]MBK2045268.1 DUF1722 domain-containing protein [Allofrancisella guangzhouensis]